MSVHKIWESYLGCFGHCLERGKERDHVTGSQRCLDGLCPVSRQEERDKWGEEAKETEKERERDRDGNRLLAGVERES